MIRYHSNEAQVEGQKPADDLSDQPLKILWVPHTPTDVEGWEGSRQYHLFRHLCARHRVNWVSWTQSSRFRDTFRWGRVDCLRTPVGEKHTVHLAPAIYRLINRGYPRPYQVALNQFLFRRAIRRLFRRITPDVLVYSGSFHFTGFPPFDLQAPIVLDYVDRNETFVEAAYVSGAESVIAVSEGLAAAAEARGRPAVVIPNGVDVDRYRGVERSQAKARLGLGNGPVVSLIGLTCAPSFYFLDAIASIQSRVPDLKLLVVGGGATREAIVAKASKLGLKNFQAVGPVPNADVHWYFAATDVGLYPGENIPYYRESSPLKIVEYVAAGSRVVSSPVNLFRTGWPTVEIVEPTAAAFEAAIGHALDAPRPVPRQDLRDFDWATLAQRFDAELQKVVRSGRVRDYRPQGKHAAS